MKNSKMRMLLLAGVSSIAITTYASAADAPVYKGPGAPLYNWSGTYFGLHAGVGMLDHKQTYVDENGLCGDFAGASCNLAASGFVFGAQVGHLWQSGSFAWGIEADISRTGLNSTAAAGGTGYTLTGNVDWLASLRARAGYVHGSMFAYVTGGLAAGHLKSGWVGDFYSGSLNTWKTGFVIGAGLEHMLAPNKTLRLEVLYYDLGTTSATFSGPGFGPYATNFDHKILVGRIAYNHRW